MTASTALQHYKKFGGFYLDAKGHRALYKLIKRQTKIIRQAKCATAEACEVCRRIGECEGCHVNKLVQMINKEDDRDGQQTGD